MKRCYKKHPLHPEEEAEETLVERSEDAVLASTEAQDDGPCGGWAQTKCSIKASVSWDVDGVYEKCMQKCLDEYNGAALSQRSETVDDTVQLEAADLATAEAQGIAEIDPCGATMQAWCTYRAYVTWWFMGGFEHVYEKCMAKCLPSQITKRSEVAKVDDDLTEQDEDSGIYPQEGRLGGLRGVNDADNHVCNNTEQYAKCSFLASLQFWHPIKAFRRCLAECVRKHDGDNWTAEDVEGYE
jgi:hypothetical protein